MDFETDHEIIEEQLFVFFPSVLADIILTYLFSWKCPGRYLHGSSLWTNIYVRSFAVKGGKIFSISGAAEIQIRDLTSDSKIFLEIKNCLSLTDLAVSEDRLFMLDYWLNCLHICDHQGNYLACWNRENNRSFTKPLKVVRFENSIYVLDQKSLQVFTYELFHFRQCTYDRTNSIDMTINSDHIFTLDSKGFIQALGKTWKAKSYRFQIRDKDDEFYPHIIVASDEIFCAADRTTIYVTSLSGDLLGKWSLRDDKCSGNITVMRIADTGEIYVTNDTDFLIRSYRSPIVEKGVKYSNCFNIISSIPTNHTIGRMAALAGF